MDKYRRFLPITIFIVLVALIIAGISYICMKCYDEYTVLQQEEQTLQDTLSEKQDKRRNIENKIRSLKRSLMEANKRIYYPGEGQPGDDTLFFTLYSDLIEMVNSNSVKIDTISYQYNPPGDIFVAQQGAFFVCDVNLKLVSNYVNLGKLIQDIYQYPYYMKINSIDVYPYPKDKKVLLTTMSVRLFAHTQTAEVYFAEELAGADDTDTVDGASTPIPQE